MLWAGSLLLIGIENHLEMGWLDLFTCYPAHGVRYALSRFALMRQPEGKPPQSSLPAARGLPPVSFWLLRGEKIVG